jgi:cold shock protein
LARPTAVGVARGVWQRWIVIGHNINESQNLVFPTAVFSAIFNTCQYATIRKISKKMTQAVVTGVVKWFNNTKGYGFIRMDGSETDIFVHYSGITGSGYKSLEEGQRVQFTVAQGQKGQEARDVARL